MAAQSLHQAGDLIDECSAELIRLNAQIDAGEADRVLIGRGLNAVAQTLSTLSLSLRTAGDLEEMGQHAGRKRSKRATTAFRMVDEHSRRL